MCLSTQGHVDYGTIFGMAAEQTPASAPWNTFVALGSMAFSYSFCIILIEITDTMKQEPKVPRSETAHMKKAAKISISITVRFLQLLESRIENGRQRDEISSDGRAFLMQCCVQFCVGRLNSKWQKTPMEQPRQ